MEFSGQEYWSGLPFPSPGDLPDPGMEPGSPALQADSLPSEPPGKPSTVRTIIFKKKQRKFRNCRCNYASSSKTLYFLQNTFLSCTENAAFMWMHDGYKKVIPINYNKI